MAKILVVGAGLVARPLVRYLAGQDGMNITLADQDADAAESLAAPYANCLPVRLDVSDGQALSRLISDHAVVVSLLPAHLHLVVAELCLEHERHLVTASYVSPAVEALARRAEKAGLTFLFEAGLDPGLDHMSAMRVIHDVRRRGGRISRFRSYCGGVPAPEADDNPWHYKISWSPRGVCMAANSTAQFAQQGRVVTATGAEVFEDPTPIEVDDLARFEAYPNRDSLKYIELYGLRDIDTMYRGTLRYPGWCETMSAALGIDLFSDEKLTISPPVTPSRVMAERAGAAMDAELSGDLARELVARKLGISKHDEVLDRFAYLGLFDDDPIEDPSISSPLDLVAAAMSKKLAYAPGERDLVVMKHYFGARFEARNIEEHITVTLVAYGEPGGDSAMSRTVGLPAGIAAKLLATGELDWPGVRIPVAPQVYDPILDSLAAENVRFVETRYCEPL